jgi:ABC-type Zn uptake system ZnuABC Zn-binding protein ZnuA
MTVGFRRALQAAGALVWIVAMQGCGPASFDQPGAEFVDAEYVTTLADLVPVEIGQGERLRVVATTNIVGDVVANVGGEAVELTVLLPSGADPHGYVATPRELAEASEAGLLFLSGFGLEEGMGGTLEQLAVDVPIVSISEGVQGIPMADGAEELGHEGEESRAEESGAGEEPHAEGGVDPHVWFDPSIVMQWTRNAAAALSALDPANQVTYQANADTYVESLGSLDAWIKESVAAILPARRVLVTDHFVFGYFARRYGFEIVGAVIPAYSSSASPSPQDLGDLLGAIQEHGVKAVFVGLSANADAAQAVAQDAGIQVVPLYTESLSEPGGPADSYLGMLEYNVNAIVEALR